MAESLVVIEHNGDYVTCIDTSKEDGQIVTWSWLDDGKIVKIADNFEKYFTEKLEDCL
ncbi:MAG: SMI1/KNR4 family protein [Lachnospiraceae bacterium]|nr:SMI1/KNR4 family protein [Lachnospiraceae bacterium]